MKVMLLNEGCYCLKSEKDYGQFPITVEASCLSKSGRLVFVSAELLDDYGFLPPPIGEHLAFWLDDPLGGDPEAVIIEE